MLSSVILPTLLLFSSGSRAMSIRLDLTLGESSTNQVSYGGEISPFESTSPMDDLQVIQTFALKAQRYVEQATKDTSITMPVRNLAYQIMYLVLIFGSCWSTVGSLKK